MIEIESLEELDHATARAEGSMRGWQVQGLDLVYPLTPEPGKVATRDILHRSEEVR